MDLYMHLNELSRWIPKQMDLLRNLDEVSVWILYRWTCGCTWTLLLLVMDAQQMDMLMLIHDVLCIKYKYNIENTYEHRNKYKTALSPTLPYITWGLIWDLKTRKHKDPEVTKENLNIYIYRRKKLYNI